MLAFTGGHPVWQESRTWGCSDEHKKKANQIIEALEGLVRAGVNGVGVVWTIIKQQMQPLKKGAHTFFEYFGVTDNSRECPESLQDTEIPQP